MVFFELFDEGDAQRPELPQEKISSHNLGFDRKDAAASVRKRGRRMTDEHRAKLSAAQRERWAARRASLAGLSADTEDTPKIPLPLSNVRALTATIPTRPVVVAPKRAGETKRTHRVEESKTEVAWTRYFNGVLS